jgi:hypothetical protein
VKSCRILPLGVPASAVVAAVVAGYSPEVSGQARALDETVARLSSYVTRYYARAQAVVVEENVSVQPLQNDLTASGFARRLTYELRVEWNPEAAAEDAAKVVRRLLKVNGRTPDPRREPECLDPNDVSPEPLAFLLPERRHAFNFTLAGQGNVDGRPALMLDFRSVRPEAPIVEWDDECASIDLPGRSRGRVWTDPENGEVLRFDEHLIGIVDVAVPVPQQRRGARPYLTVERADMSIRYRRVSFENPDETLLLPASIETVTIIRNSGVPRVRTTQTFANYRRFATESRVVQ